MRAEAGDAVLHLRGIAASAAFVGFSTSARDGFVTQQRPPRPSRWAYARRFYRLPLKDYEPFPVPAPLPQVFPQQGRHGREYFRRNRAPDAPQRRKIFCATQSGTIQCLNGPYLTEVDDELAQILLGPDFSGGDAAARPRIIDLPTGDRIQQVRRRVEQKRFMNAATVRALKSTDHLSLRGNSPGARGVPAPVQPDLAIRPVRESARTTLPTLGTPANSMTTGSLRRSNGSIASSVLSSRSRYMSPSSRVLLVLLAEVLVHVLDGVKVAPKH